MEPPDLGNQNSNLSFLDFFSYHTWVFFPTLFQLAGSFAFPSCYFVCVCVYVCGILHLIFRLHMIFMMSVCTGRNGMADRLRTLHSTGLYLHCNDDDALFIKIPNRRSQETQDGFGPEVTARRQFPPPPHSTTTRQKERQRVGCMPLLLPFPGIRFPSVDVGGFSLSFGFSKAVAVAAGARRYDLTSRYNFSNFSFSLPNPCSLVCLLVTHVHH